MALRIQPGVVISGHAVSDIVRLLAEIIENATMYSARDTQVRVSVQDLTSGGVLIEVSDSGVGVSEARLAEMNSAAGRSPAIDVSVSRHMGLFAVARLAERHGVRVRLRAGTPQGLTALVWLPDSLAEQVTGPYGDGRNRPPQAAFQARRTPGRHSLAVRSAPVSVQPNEPGRRASSGVDGPPAPDAATGSGYARDRGGPVGAAEGVRDWFRSRDDIDWPCRGFQPETGGPPGAAPQAGGPSGRAAGDAAIQGLG